MSLPPSWVIALTYWLHMLATVVWVGSLAALNLLVLPAAAKTLNLAEQVDFLSAMQKRLEPLAWFSMGLLLATGLFQLSVNPHYDGFLNVSAQWSLSILIKHSLAAILAVTSAIQTWEILPAIRRVLLKKEKADEGELQRLQRRELILLRVNLLLSALILGATAFARAA
mgnify:CR=1 FL=1